MNWTVFTNCIYYPSCQADGNPVKMTYQWYVDDIAVNGNQGTELEISNIGRDRHEKIVKCQVRNKIGKSEQTETLNILCEYH